MVLWVIYYSRIKLAWNRYEFGEVCDATCTLHRNDTGIIFNTCVVGGSVCVGRRQMLSLRSDVGIFLSTHKPFSTASFRGA